MQTNLTNFTKETKPKVFQGNAITDARYEMSVIEKQIVYILLSDIKKDDRARERLDYEIKAQRIKEFSQKTVVNYTVLREATKKLVSRVYEIWNKDREGRYVLTQTTLLSSAKYKQGSGTILLSLSKDIKPYLMDLAKGFTVYSLDYALSLKSIYSQRMYELLSRYKDLGLWNCTVSDLRYILKIENKYTSYYMFKKKVLDVAQKELQEKTDINFTYEEVKNGRRFEKIIFYINHKDTSTSLELEFDITIKQKNILISEFRLSKWQADKIVKTMDTKSIGKIIYNIRIQVNSNNVKNIGGYAWSTFQKAGVD